METGSRDTVELQGKRKHVGINKLSVKQIHGSYGKQKQKIPSRPVSVTQGKCYRCGGDHKAKTCRHLNTKCRYCGNPGHLEKVCFKKQRDMGSGKIHYVDVEDDNAESGNDCSYLLHFDYSDVNKITVEPIIVKPKNRRGGNSYGSGHWSSCVDNTQRDSGSIPHEVQTPLQ